MPNACVCDFSRSPRAALRPVPVNAVTLTDSFWAPRLKTNREVTIPSQLRQCEESGRIDNLRLASGRKEGKFQGLFFNDSDVYKWAEAAAWSLASHPDAGLEADLEAVVDEIAAAQQPDGYLNSYFLFERAGERYANLTDLHEIYCAGHLIQAAVAHKRATGRDTFLDVAVRLADNLERTFGDAPGKRPGACGHPEAEMALVELYRETGERRYLDLARHMIDVRGRTPPVLGGKPYHQDHARFVDMPEVTGHAVRMLYLCCGAADAALEDGAFAYRDRLETLWQNFTTKRMYVTGGAGARHEGEAFGEDYELPNERAYAETCAAIASVMWNWRMLHLTGEARFADLMEHTLYNAVLPGLSLDGARYFYENPLADAGKHRRQEWFGCACCPPNLARLLASLPGYFYSTEPNGIWLHLYAAGTATVPLPNGETVTLTQTTQYPWDSVVEISVDSASSQDAEFLYLRIPGWAEGARLEVDGEAVDLNGVENGGYAEITLMNGMGGAGKKIRLTLPMPVERVHCHPHVSDNRGRVALRRGPLVYCIEQADHAADVRDIRLPADAELTPEFLPALPGGVMALRGRGTASAPANDMPLYPVKEVGAEAQAIDVTAIPYYAWANREAGPMLVWIPGV